MSYSVGELLEYYVRLEISTSAHLGYGILKQLMLMKL